MIFNWLKKTKPKRDTVEYGRYLHKPVLQRVVQHICGLDSQVAIEVVERGEVRLNYQAVSDPGQRLHSGRYRLRYGKTIYLFYIV